MVVEESVVVVVVVVVEESEVTSESESRGRAALGLRGTRRMTLTLRTTHCMIWTAASKPTTARPSTEEAVLSWAEGSQGKEGRAVSV